MFQRPIRSLTCATFIKIAVIIALLIVAMTLASYWLAFMYFESQKLEQLEKFAIERSHGESGLF